MKLLIVNDEVIAAKGVMTGIDWGKYGIDEVRAAYESESARRLLESIHFDILLCDIEMPGENGIELVRWIRKNDYEIEVIFLTCHADFEFAQEAIQLQCRNYILVPASYEVIAENVFAVVRQIEEKRRAKAKQQYGELWLEERKKENEEENTSNSTEKSVENVKEYISRHLNDPEMTVNKIALNMHMNSDYLNRIFKKSTGKSIGHYILGMRMEMASDLLVREKMKATRVSEIVGYNTYSAFVAAFKNYFGYPPSKHS